MSKKKDTRPRDKKLAPIADSLPLDAQGQPLARPVDLLTDAEAFEVLQGAPAQIAPKTPDNPAGQLTTAVMPGAHGAPVPVPSVVLPVGKRGDKGFVWELDEMWTERVERMAQVAGLTAQGYLDSLLRRAWVGLDQRHRGRL